MNPSFSWIHPIPCGPVALAVKSGHFWSELASYRPPERRFTVNSLCRLLRSRVQIPRKSVKFLAVQGSEHPPSLVVSNVFPLVDVASLLRNAPCHARAPGRGPAPPSMILIRKRSSFLARYPRFVSSRGCGSLRIPQAGSEVTTCPCCVTGRPRLQMREVGRVVGPAGTVVAPRLGAPLGTRRDLLAYSAQPLIPHLCQAYPLLSSPGTFGCDPRSGNRPAQLASGGQSPRRLLAAESL